VSGYTFYYTGKAEKLGNPVKLLANERVIQLEFCGERTLVLTPTKLMRIGVSWYQEMSDNGVFKSAYFKPHDILKIQMKCSSVLVLLKNGKLYSMKVSKDIGRDEVDSEQFTLVANNVDNVWTGFYHSHFTKRDGSFYAFGYNPDGRCGVQSPGMLHTPQEIVCMRDKVVMAAVGCFSTILTKDGKVYAAGATENMRTFTLVKGLGDAFITKIVAGGFGSLLLSSNGRLYAYGRVTDTKHFPEDYDEALEIKRFTNKRIIDIGVVGHYEFSVMTWE
jgi:alpha-tubulin suppressor-like RCC1 family protein